MVCFLYSYIMLDYDSSFTQQKAVNLLIMLIIAYIWLIYMWFIQSADLSTTYFLWGATVWHLRLYIFLFIYFFWFITGSLLRLCFCEIHVSKADSYRRENYDFYFIFFLHTEGIPPNGIWISIHICMNWLSLRKNGRVRPLAAQQNMKMAIFYSAVVPDDFKMDIQFIWSYNWTLYIFYSVIKQ